MLLNKRFAVRYRYTKDPTKTDDTESCKCTSTRNRWRHQRTTHAQHAVTYKTQSRTAGSHTRNRKSILLHKVIVMMLRDAIINCHEPRANASFFLSSGRAQPYTLIAHIQSTIH